jgi:hypothetical protein
MAVVCGVRDEGHQQLMAGLKRKIIDLKLDEIKNNMEICTINEVQMTGCCAKNFEFRAVAKEYDDVLGENHPDNKYQFYF